MTFITKIASTGNAYAAPQQCKVSAHYAAAMHHLNHLMIYLSRVGGSILRSLLCAMLQLQYILLYCYVMIGCRIAILAMNQASLHLKSELGSVQNLTILVGQPAMRPSLVTNAHSPAKLVRICPARGQLRHHSLHCWIGCVSSADDEMHVA